MAIYTNMNGTNANDTLTYNKGGSNIIYHAGKGNDIIKITGGTLVNVITDGGNNTINVTGGSQHTIKIAETDALGNTIAGIDKLTISGAHMIDASLGSGKDEIVITNSNGRKANGALSQIRGGIWGDVFTTNTGAQKYQLYGEDGDDSFTVNAGSDMNFWGAAGRDIFEIKGGTNNKFYGGDSEDTFNIRYAKQYVVLGYGGSVSQRLYDTVNVYSGAEQTILCNLGINQINLYAGNSHIIKADIDKALSKKNGYTDAQINAGIGLGYGVDNILIQGAGYVTANTGDGKDVVIVKGGTGHHIYTEGWGDTIKLSGNITNSVFDAGGADDTYEIEWRYFGSGNIIDQRSAGENDNDIVRITDTASTKFNYAIDGIDFIITEKTTRKQLIIRGWGNGINSVTFSDRTLTGTQFFQELIIQDGLEHGDVKLGEAVNGEINSYSIKLENGTANNLIAAMDYRNPETVNPSQNYIANDNTITISMDGKVLADKQKDLDGDAKAAYVVNGSAGNNKVIVNGGLVEGAIMGAQVEKGSAQGNAATITGGSVGEVYGAEGYNVALSGNKVTMSGGSAGNVYGSAGALGSVTENTVDMTGGTAVNVIGGYGEKQTASGSIVVDGNVVTLGNTATVTGAAIGGKAEAQNATNNKIVMKGNSTAGNVYGGYAVVGTASDNSITMSGNSVVTGDAYINYSETGATGDGFAHLQDKAEIKGTLYGSEGKDTIEIINGKVNNIETATGEDTITISGGTINTLDTGAGADSISVSKGTIGEIVLGAGDDTVTVTGGTITKIDGVAGANVINVEGGSVQELQGGTGSSTMNIKAGTVSAITTGAASDTITVDGGTVTAINGGAGNDTIVLNGGSVGTIDAGTGKDTISIVWTQLGKNTVINQRSAGVADNDEIKIVDGFSTNYTFSLAGDVLKITDANGKQLLIEGWGNGTNSVVFADKKLTGTEFFRELEIKDGLDHEEVKLGLPNDNSVSDYVLKLTNGSANSLYAAYDNTDATAAVVAANNTLTIGAEGQVVGVQDNSGKVIVAFVNKGTAENNKAILDGGSVEGDIKAAELNSGAASANIVTVASGSARDIYGAYGSNAELSENKAIVNGGTVRNAYGAAAENGTIYNNSVELKQGNVAAVYGGYSLNGAVHDNSVNIAGTALVDGNVYANYSVNGTVGAGTVTVSQQAKVKGTIYGGSDVDNIIINNGEVSAIDSGAGDDVVTVADGKVTTIKTGNGNDSITVSGGQVTAIEGGSGTNSFTITGGQVSSFIGGADDDTITISGGHIGTINAGQGKDSIILDWNNIEGDIVLDQTTAGSTDNDLIKLTGVDSVEFSFSIESGVFTAFDADGKKLQILGWEQGTKSITFDDKTLTGEDFFPSKELLINDGLIHGEIKWGNSADSDLEDYSVKLMNGSATGIYAAFDKNAKTDFSNTINATNNTVLIGLQGSVIKNEAAGLLGDVRAASIVKGSATENSVTMNGGSVAGSLAAAEVVQGDACDNTVNIKGVATLNSDGFIAGGITDTGEASRNVVDISSQNVNLHYTTSGSALNRSKGFVAGGQTQTGNAESNSVNIIAGNYHSVFGGRQYAHLEGVDESTLDPDTITTKGNVVNNTVTLGGKVKVGAYAYAGHSDIGNANNNELNIGSIGEIDEITYASPDVFMAYGGSSYWGDAKNNEVNIYGEARVNTAIAGASEGGSQSSVMNNTTTITADAEVDKAVGGFSTGIEEGNVTVTGNKVVIDGGIIGNAYGAEVSKYAGSVSQNSVTMSGGTAQELYGALGEIYNFSMDGTVINNSVTMTGGSASLLVGGAVLAGVTDGEAYAGSGMGNALRNKVTVSGDAVVSQHIMGGQSEFGDANQNTVLITDNAQVKEVVGGYSTGGSANDNSVTLKGQVQAIAVAADSTSKYVIGGLAGLGSNGIANNNTVIITDDAVVDAVYGGSNEAAVETTGEVSDNEVQISGKAYVKGDVAGGLVENGFATNNRVFVSGSAIIDGNLYSNMVASGGSGVTGSGEITVSDAATINGTIYGGAGTDTISILDGNIGDIASGAGDDAITISAGTVKEIFAGVGQDNILVESGNVTAVYGEAGRDTITVDDGLVGTIDGGQAADEIVINNGEVSLISGGDGDDHITINGGKVKTVNGGTSADTITVNGGEIEFIEAGSGSDLITIDWSNYSTGLTIDQTSSLADDVDKIVLKNAVSTVFTYTVKNSILNITDNATGKQLFVRGWNKGVSSIFFDDKEVTDEDMFPDPTDAKSLVLKDGQDRGEIIWGTAAEAGSIFGYTVKLKNGSTEDIYAAKGTNSDVRDNTVIIAGGQVNGDIYAGYTVNGRSENNSITVTRDGRVTGNLYANYSVNGTVGDSSVEVGDEAVVEGTVFGGTGADTVYISGGSVQAIATGEGNDNITLDSGFVSLLDCGIGTDTISVLSGEVETLRLTDGNNTVTAAGGKITELAISGGSNTVNIEGGTITNINPAAGTTNVNISSGLLENIDLTKVKTMVNVTGGTVENITGTAISINQNQISVGATDSKVTVTKGSVENAFGSGTINATNATLDKLALHGSDNNDSFTLNNSQLNSVATGAGTDTVNIQNNTVLQELLLGSGTNNVNITSSQVKAVDGSLGEDNFTLRDGELEVVAGIIESLSLAGGNNVVTAVNSTINNVSGGSGNDKLLLQDGNIVVSRSGSYAVDMESGDNTVAFDNDGSGSITASIKGGTGDDSVTVGNNATANLVDGDIEQVYITSSSGIVNVDGADVDSITVAYSSDWSSTKININDGYVNRIDASTGSATVNLNGGVLEALEGSEIKGENNSVKVGKATVNISGGEVRSYAASGTVKLQSINIETPIVGTDADNVMTITSANVTYLETGAGDDEIAISKSKIDTLKLNGGRNLVKIAEKASQWEDTSKDDSHIENLILEGDINTVEIYSPMATVANVVANGKMDMLNITGGTVTITEGTLEVLGIKEGSAPANVILDGGDIGLLCAKSSNIKMPNITIKSGKLGGVCGTYSNNANITGIKMNLSNTGDIGTVIGGYANGEGAEQSSIANSCTINLDNCGHVEEIYAGKAESISGRFSTNAMGNVINITGDINAGTIYAGYVDGAFTGVTNDDTTHANHNKVYLKDSTASIVVNEIYAGYAKDTGFAPNFGAKSRCQISYNNVEIAVANAKIGSVCAGFSTNAPGRVTLNEINVTGSTTGSLEIDNIYGGKATDFGTAGLTYMAGNQNKVNITHLDKAKNIYGCFADNGGEAILNNIKINGCGEVENLYGGYADCASAQFADVVIDGGTSINKIYGGYNSGVNIGVTYNNKLNIKNVDSLGTVYGGYSDLNCTYAAFENKVFISDSTVNRIYVGYNISTSGAVQQSATNSMELPSSDGGTEMNLVAALGNTTVTGDVYVNYATSYGNSNNNMFYLGGTSKVLGSIIGNGNADIVGVSGGNVKNINTNAGADKIRVSGGEIQTVDAGAGNDYIFVTSGHIKALQGGVGADTIVVDYSGDSSARIGVEEINGDTSTGSGNDIIVVKGSYAPETTAANVVNGGGGDDCIKVSSNFCKAINGGDGNDIIFMTGSAATVNGDAGDDIIRIDNGRNNTFNVGSGNDTVVIETSGTIYALQIDYAAGSDAATVVLNGAELSTVTVSHNDNSWLFTSGNDDITINNDTNHVTRIYCDDGYLDYDSSLNDYVAHNDGVGYTGTALAAINDAANTFSKAELSLTTFDKNFFTEAELKVTGNS